MKLTGDGLEICILLGLCCAGGGCNLAADGGMNGSSGVLGVGRSRRLGGVKGDPSYTYRGQEKHERKDGDGMLTKSSEEDAFASDMVVQRYQE